MIDYIYSFVAAFVLNATLTVRSSDLWKSHCVKLNQQRQNAKMDESAQHHKQVWENLIFRYLVVYLLATAADWLQGAYIYVLYHEMGYTKYDIGVLFIAGFGSSAVFGSFIGGMADTKGRRLFVVVYGAAYALSCVTKRTLLNSMNDCIGQRLEKKPPSVGRSNSLTLGPLVFLVASSSYHDTHHNHHHHHHHHHQPPTATLDIHRLQYILGPHYWTHFGRHCHESALFHF